MVFNISQLDGIEYDGSDDSLEKIEEYQDYIFEEFIKSEEGVFLQNDFSDIGFWIRQLIYYGYSYLGVSLASMDVDDIKEILSDIFPRKISLEFPDDANEIIPELLAFWRFIQKKYEVDKLNKILNYLCEVENSYFHIMNDSSKFGMAKSFMMQGSSSGFDMSNPDEANQFINEYNQNLLIASSASSLTDEGSNSPIMASISKKAQLKKKKLRKMKKASRKKNKK